jgi:CRISPR-associated protein Cas5d
MQSPGPSLVVKVWGEYACFTRPEMKVERVSYPVMTPSAARGVLEAIFWKPEFCWLVREILVLRDIKFFSIRRNEIGNKASTSPASHPYYADEDRQQRHTLALRDVAYIIRADIALADRGTAEHPAKYRDQFRRRVERGECHHQPYLGCREFSAFFAPPTNEEQPIASYLPLGQMLFDLDYQAEDGCATPRFFEAVLDDGVLRVPSELYERRESYAAR